jgi:hypothetical protein
MSIFLAPRATSASPRAMSEQRPANIVSLDPLALMRRDGGAAERVWNQRDAAAQLAYLLAAPRREWERLVAMSHHPIPLVDAIPPQELWLTLQEVGGSEAMTLFGHASVEQVQFCLDVEGWRKDRWDSDATFEWVRLIAACGPEKIVRFFREHDAHFIALILKRWISIYIRESTDEDVTTSIAWPRDDAPHTLDGVYYFQVADERIDQWLRPMLDTYGRADLEGLHLLLKALLGVMSSEQEELAFEHRGRRLADSGFPAFDTAIEIYHRFRVLDAALLLRRTAAVGDNIRAPIVPQALVAAPCEDCFFAEVWKGLDPLWQEQVERELVRVANALVIADGHRFNAEVIHRSMRKAVAYLNVGLETLSGGAVSDAVALVESYWIRSIFQMGFTRIMMLSDHAKQWMADHPLADPSEDPADAEAMCHERIRAASWRWPKYYVGPQSADGVLHRDFGTLHEIVQVERDLES